jgi:hypothetical protein
MFHMTPCQLGPLQPHVQLSRVCWMTCKVLPPWKALEFSASLRLSLKLSLSGASLAIISLFESYPSVAVVSTLAMWRLIPKQYFLVDLCNGLLAQRGVGRRWEWQPSTP